MNDNRTVWSPTRPSSFSSNSKCDLELTRQWERKKKNCSNVFLQTLCRSKHKHTGSCGRVIITRHFLRADVGERRWLQVSHLCESASPWRPKHRTHTVCSRDVFFFFFFFLEGSEPDRWFIVLLGKRLNSTFSRAEEEPDRPPCPVYGSSCSEQIRGGLKHVSDKAPASDFPRDQTRVEKRSIDANPNSEKSWFSSVLALLLPSRHPPPGLLRNPAAAPLLAPQRSRLNTLWKTLLQASVAAGTCVYLASFKRLFQSFKHPGRRIKES